MLAVKISHLFLLVIVDHSLKTSLLDVKPCWESSLSLNAPIEVEEIKTTILKILNFLLKLLIGLKSIELLIEVMQRIRITSSSLLARVHILELDFTGDDRDS